MAHRAYSLIIFDWDGTLMDSASKIVHCFRRAFSDVGAAYPGDNAVRYVIGLGLKEAVNAMMPSENEQTRNAVMNRYREYFLGLDAEELVLFPGVRECLQELTAKSCLLAVATGKSRRGLDRVLSSTGLREFFTITRCADEALSKPHPRMLEDILSYTGMTSDQAIMVGDTTHDMLMARAANMDGLAVCYGAHAREELLASSPVACCASFEEVRTWLQNYPTSPFVKAVGS